MWQGKFFGGLRQTVDLAEAGGEPDFAVVGGGLELKGLRVDTPGALAAAMDEAFSCDRPVVLDVRVDPDATPIHSYRRRLDEGKSYPRPGTIYQLPPWRRSPDVRRSR